MGSSAPTGSAPHKTLRKRNTTLIFTQENGFYKTLLAVALPTAGSNLLQNAIGLADTFMVATLGDQAVAAVAVANNFLFVFFLLMFGLISGASVLSSQYWGRRDTRAVAQTAGIMLRFSMLAGLGFSVAALVFPRQIMSVFTADPEVIALGVGYLRIVGPSFAVMSLSKAYWLFMRSVEQANLGLFLQLTTFIVSTSLNAVFIFGLFGAPQMGVRGAATGTLIARLLEFVIVLIYASRESVIRIRVRDILGKAKRSRQLLSDFYHHSSIVVANEIVWGLGTSLQSAIFGHISTPALTAASLTRSMMSAASVPSFGLFNAAGVVTGKSVGRGEFKTAKRQSKLLLLLALFAGIVCTGLMLTARAVLLGPVAAAGALQLSGEVLGLLRRKMLVEAAIIPFSAQNGTIIVGLLRGGGDTKFSSIYDVAFLWLYALPAAAIAAFVFGVSSPAVYVILRAEEAIKFFVGIIRVLNWKWMRNVTRQEIPS